MKNRNDDGVWQMASTNEGNELKHSKLLQRTIELMGDTMALVSSSCSIINENYASRCQEHDNDHDTALCYGKACI